MSFLRNNVAVFAVAIVAATLVWVFGGTRGALLIPIVPWLFVLMIEVLYCFPQRQGDENVYEARQRVTEALKRDAVAWLVFAFLCLMIIPFVNKGLCTTCDAALIKTEELSPNPPIPILPSCVNRLDHLNVFLWFLIALPTLLVVKHALSRYGKRLVLEFIVWNGAAVALLGFIQNAAGAPGPLWNTASGLTGKAGDFFATFGYPNMAGDYFVSLFGISIALWRYHFDEVTESIAQMDSTKASNLRGVFWQRNYFLIPAAVFFFAAMNTLSRAAIMLATALTVIFFIHSFISLVAKMHRASRVRIGAVCLIAIVILITAVSAFMPADLQREVDTIGTTEVLDRVSGRGQYHTRVATEIWKDHRLFGCGGWGYVHYCIPKMTEQELKRIQMVGGINVHNDHLQFLAEHGLVGFGILVAIVLLLLAPIFKQWRRMCREIRFLKEKERPPRPVQIFVLPASVFALLMAILATFIHAFGDCPLRSPAVLTLFFIILAALPGFMPRSTHPHSQT